MKPLLASTAALVLIAGLATAQKPSAHTREIASLPGVAIWELSWLPNGRIALFTTNDSLFAYDLGNHATTPVARGDFSDITMSPLGNRVAFVRSPDGAQTAAPGEAPHSYIWSMPIDSETGAARGAPQRVSVVQGTDPSFLADGKTVVFAAYRPGHKQDLVAVPATGGPERTITSFNNFITPFPATDGKSVFALPRTNEKGPPVTRVDLATGKQEIVPWAAGAAGGSPMVGDERIRFAFSAAQQRIAYTVANGEDGWFQAPPGFDYFYWDALPRRNGRGLLVEERPASSVHVVRIATGADRELPGTAATENGSYSRDGRIAYQTTDRQGSAIVISGPGAASRRYIIEGGLNSAPMEWSPDGTKLLFLGPARATLNALDVRSGRVQLIDSASDGLGHFVWRNTGTVTYARPSGANGVSFYDATLEGTKHKLRDLPATIHPTGFMFFPSPDAIAVATSAGGVLVSMRGSANRRLPNMDAVRAVPSDDGRWILALLRTPEGKPSRLLLVSTQSDSTRTIDLPFEVRFGPGPSGPYARLTGDARQALMLGAFPGDSVTRLFSVPMDGREPRALVALAGEPTRFEPSPDGRDILVQRNAIGSSVISEVDLSSVLAAATNRKPE